MTVRAVEAQFGPENAVSLVEAHDLVLDCTDNVLTRYLISDAGVLADKPILSGAAQGYEGQLITLHQSLGGEQRGPCYRCLFPQSPRPEHTQSCDDGGILGCVTGLVGTWQAMEAIKVLTGLGDKTPNMLFFTPMSIPQVRSVRVRPRQVRTCRACGGPDVPEKITDLTRENYITFCGITEVVDDVPSVEAQALQRPDVLVVDVRPWQEYELTHLPMSMRTLPIVTHLRFAMGYNTSRFYRCQGHDYGRGRRPRYPHAMPPRQRFT